jgi:hypothetical protein
MSLLRKMKTITQLLLNLEVWKYSGEIESDLKYKIIKLYSKRVCYFLEVHITLDRIAMSKYSM